MILRQVPNSASKLVSKFNQKMLQLLFVGAAIYLLTRQDPTIRRIKEALDEWEPEDDEDWNEADFRSDLADYLRDDDYYLIEESGVRRGRRDIWIQAIDSDTEVVIEVKLELSSANEVRRLIGQIAAYSEQAKAIFVVLIDPDGNMLDELRISLGAWSCKEKVEIVCREVDEGLDEDEEDEGFDEEDEDEDEDEDENS